MKRQRGLKRYYRNLAIQIDFETPTWKIYFNDPNDSFKRRKPHLDKLFRHFDFLVEKTKKINSDFQLYTVLLDFDSSNDALFLHTPKPNNSQFPFKIEDLSKTTTLTNKALDEYIEKLSGYERLYGQASQAFCLLYKRNVGRPF
jgi:hypothetical protein